MIDLDIKLSIKPAHNAQKVASWYDYISSSYYPPSITWLLGLSMALRNESHLSTFKNFIEIHYFYMFRDNLESS